MLEVVRYTPGLRTGERLIAVSGEVPDAPFTLPVVLVQRPGEVAPLGLYWAFRFREVPREVLS